MVTQNNFYIRRNPKSLIYSIVGVVATLDALYLFIILLLTLVRDVVGLDTLILISGVLMFIAKTGVEIVWILKLMNIWASNEYYVIDGKIIVENHSSNGKSTSHNLKDLTSIEVDRNSFLGMRLNSGNIIISFKQDDIKLIDVRGPKMMADRISKLGG